ncbi:dTDP-4-dehydrorhamnose reductase [Arenimonas daejeonensis]|uniref:dTDP-4-dehydrorhamnose reductase n=1 Tax=Arenimonas daejeonensis TaxID=370777 RepID=UPI0011BD7F44|nr:dTDP-4-dehydrorhamnose reductase [Arenimonas daejeonensis]
MRILLAGADGQVGFELRRTLAPLGEVMPTTLSGQLPDGGSCLAADFADPSSLGGLVERTAPDLVVNAAAYTAVDRAEQEPDLAWRINADAPAALAEACARRAIPIVHYSTDYVFDGSGERPWRETDPAAPLNAYGAGKWAGEQAVRTSGAAHKIFRLCWVYGPRGSNFLLTMLRLGRERDQLRVVADQVGTPTPAAWIAAATAQALIARPQISGTWHLAAGGQASWFEFASEIFRQAATSGVIQRAPEVQAITTADFPTPARRPAWSVLDTTALAEDFDIRLPDWRTGVTQCLESLSSA